MHFFLIMAPDSGYRRADAQPVVQGNMADMPRTRLYLVRHGALVTSDEWRYVGQQDIELSDEGRGQIAALAQRLSDVRITAAYCSDLGRTVESARLLCNGRGLEPVACREFREIDIGHWEGMTLAEIMERFPYQPDYVFNNLGEVDPDTILSRRDRVET